MPARLPVQGAVEAARMVFASRVGDGVRPSHTQLFDAIREYEQLEFDVPDLPDADGFLFQFGSVGWLPEPTFSLGFTRQLELVDSSGEHESYIQVAMDFHFAPDGDLDTVDSVSSWWFRGSNEEFASWLQSIESDRIWRIVSGKSAREFVISEDEV